MTLDDAVAEYVKWVDEAEAAGDFPPSLAAGAALRSDASDVGNFRRGLYLRHPDMPARIADLRAKAQQHEREALRGKVEALQQRGLNLQQAADKLGVRREYIRLRLGSTFEKRVIDWPALWGDLRPHLPMSFPEIRRRYDLSSRTLQYHVEMNAPEWLGFARFPMYRQRDTWWAWDKETGHKPKNTNRRPNETR